jgi:hypothetical protein
VRLRARGNAAPRGGGRYVPPHGGGTGANPPFSFAERKCAVDGGKETGALPGQGFGRDPCAGVTTGVGHVPHFGAGKRSGRGSRGLPGALDDCPCCHFAAADWQLNRRVRGVLDDCPCCLFAAAVRCEAGAFCVGFTQRLLRPPDCGSKMTAGTIGDEFYRTQFYNSRGRDS